MSLMIFPHILNIISLLCNKGLAPRCGVMRSASQSRLSFQYTIEHEDFEDIIILFFSL